MAYRIRYPCFICDAVLIPRAMVRIDREEDALKREIARTRRDAGNRQPLDINDRTRLCNNCNISIVNEIDILQQDPQCLRLNVLTQTSSQTCLLRECNNNYNLQRLSVSCRVNIYLKRDIYVSENTKSCPEHLDAEGNLLQPLLETLRFINRPYVLKGTPLKNFLQELRNVANNIAVSRFDNENNFSDEEFSSMSPITKEQFRELFTYCDPVIQTNGFLYVTKKHLLTFLCKMRQGLSDDFLTTMFGYKSRQNTSSIIATVRKSLCLRFVPSNIGVDAITRNQYIERHVTEFSNQLYNIEPQVPRAIAFIDGTYLEVEKSSNFEAQRLSYSMHKNYNLLKPSITVAPDGYILDIHGPYFSDHHNNDAAILNHQLQRDGEQFRRWFEENDIIILDRGYRDSAPLLEQLGITMRSPPCLQRNQRQLTTEQANEARLITKSRWIVEIINGHLKSIFKFFDHRISVIHAINLSDFLKIAGAILNRYKGPIYMENADINLANQLLERAQRVNVMQARVEAENLRDRGGRWTRLNHNHFQDFPRLDLDYLRDLTVGVYQVRLAPGYIQDKILRDQNEEIQFDELVNAPGLLRARIYSRFTRSVRHQLWIEYRVNFADNENNNNVINNPPIISYYCTCKSGARTLGTCAHIASVIWFLGYARNRENVHYPSTALLENVQNARNPN